MNIPRRLKYMLCTIIGLAMGLGTWGFCTYYYGNNKPTCVYPIVPSTKDGPAPTCEGMDKYPTTEAPVDSVDREKRSPDAEADTEADVTVIRGTYRDIHLKNWKGEETTEKSTVPESTTHRSKGL